MNVKFFLYPSPSDSFVYIILFSFDMDTEQFVDEVSKNIIFHEIKLHTNGYSK